VAKAAASEAARDHAPGLTNYDFGDGEGTRRHHHHRHGAWKRHGNNIVLYGV